MIYTVNHIPTDTPCNRRPGLSMDPITITIHNTGNPASTAANERAWLTNPDNNKEASYHIAIDEWEAVECLPLNENGWHSGDGNGDGNRKSIGIEICESGNYAQTLENAVLLVARMLRERGWGIDRLRRHWDWSRKVCPRLMYDGGTWSGWFAFVDRVAAALEELKAIVEEVDKQPDDTSEWARDAREWAMSDKVKITDGTRPKDPVTREEVWTMLHRMQG